jgi:NADH-quinone oxidoreductase subunit M
LLALAAMGLPPFGVFAGFMGLLLSAPFPSLAGLFVTLLAWLAASWYIMQMVQRLLFGVRRTELRYADLLHTEFASLLIVVLVLLALGLAPTTLFASEGIVSSVIGESTTWNR